MSKQTLCKLAVLMVMGVIGTMGAGCGGLDGIRGTIVALEGNHPEYVVRDARGRERRLWTDEHTRKDLVDRGDEVRVFVTKDGYAAYIMKLDGQ
ncbi:MAG: hypothetical protein NNA23_13655 [Nitrospira sp.]|nr:hypothetical protein [Nitrospira sp.]